MQTPLSNFCKLSAGGGVGFFAPQKGKRNFTACSVAFASTLLTTINIRNAPSADPSLYRNSSYNFVES